MRVFVTGMTGFIGKHVESILIARGHDVVDVLGRPEAVIHLAWQDVGDYENEAQMENVGWQYDMLAFLSLHGVKNFVVAGTIWETCENPPAYVRAKLELYRRLSELPIILKWIRAPYLFGEGQRADCLLPSLRRAVCRGDKEFHVADASLPFMDVRDFATRLYDAIHDDRNQIANIPGVTMRVADFCRQQVTESASMNFIEDYPLRPWEK